MSKPRQSDLDHWRWIKEAGIDHFREKKTLDLGCGSGNICEKLAKGGASQVIGIDLIKPPATPVGWSFFQRNLNKKSWESDITDKFDYIFAFDILEHVESPYLFLVACRTLLSRTGILVITTPNVSSWEKQFNPNAWSGVTDKQHKILFNRYTLGFTLSRVGLSVEIMLAPIRKLQFLGRIQPQLGGQIFCMAKLAANANGGGDGET